MKGAEKLIFHINVALGFLDSVKIGSPDRELLRVRPTVSLLALDNGIGSQNLIGMRTRFGKFLSVEITINFARYYRRCVLGAAGIVPT